MEEEVKKVDLITLLRTFKKEGLDNFIVIRKEKFENNYISKLKVKKAMIKDKEERYARFKYGNDNPISTGSYDYKYTDIDLNDYAGSEVQRVLQELLDS